MASRLAVVNRGEPASRLIRAVRQLNEEGRHDITVIALQPRPSSGRCPCERPTSRCLRDDASSGSPYLDHQELERVLRVCRADSVWVGWGFVAETPAFADLCKRLGLLFIGPPAQAMRQLGDFDGPIVFCVVSRYHGGAFVVFSGVLNDNMDVIAIDGSYASVIGGAPAAAVVFAREVTSRTSKDPRLAELDAALTTEEGRQAQIRLELAELRTSVRSENLGEVAEEFEQVHNIERTRAVGSVDAIIPARDLRPYLVGAVEGGMSRGRR